MKINTLILLLLALSLMSFKIDEKKTGKTGPKELKIYRNSTERITVDLDSNDKISNSEIFNTVRYIPLETNSESVIGEIKKIKVTEDYIFVSDFTSASIIIFNRKGEYVNKLSKQGRGPDEYIDIYDFDTDKNNNIYVGGVNKMMVYSFSGKLLRSWRLPSHCHSFSLVNEEIVLNFGMKSNYKFENNYYKGIITDLYGNVLKYCMPLNKVFHEKLNSVTYAYDNIATVTGYTLLKQLDNTVYNYHYKEMQAIYEIDFGIDNFSFEGKGLSPKSQEYKMKLMKVISDKARIVNLYNLKKNLFFTVSKGMQCYLVKYNKDSKEVKCAEYKFTRRFMLSGFPEGFPQIDNIDFQKNLVGFVNPCDETEEFRKGLNLEIDSNPVITIYHTK